ncbi:MAG: hypothetical protein JXB47_03890 [Anaerolineae bacterium]|nr:hypothetical protein [Anaerolineae bacterium]
MAYVYPGRGGPTQKPKLQRGMFIGAILAAALVAFELFNFATTDYALTTILGDVQVFGVRWAAVLAIAFCAIDFAGLARLFTPEQGRDEPKEVLFLTGAWFLGASMNAVMTWWAVSNALVSRPLGNEIITREQLLTIVPIFVACLVWLTRILIIGTFGVAGERLFTLGSPTSDRSKALPSRTGARVTTGQRPPLSYRTTNRPPQQQPASQQRQAYNKPDDNEELVYEDINTGSASTNPSSRPGYTPYRGGYTRPAPKPNTRPDYNYGYSTRTYQRPQPYIVSPKAPGGDAPVGDPPDDTTPFYR